jgi:hypothetical protein
MDPCPVKVSKDKTVMIIGHKIIPACNNRENRITSVYVCGVDKNREIITYERKYTAGWSNGKIYCEKCSYVNPFCTETPLTDITDLKSLQEYDRIHYHGSF